jgi:hypothetical protein
MSKHYTAKPITVQATLFDGSEGSLQGFPLHDTIHLIEPDAFDSTKNLATIRNSPNPDNPMPLVQEGRYIVYSRSDGKVRYDVLTETEFHDRYEEVTP